MLNGDVVNCIAWLTDFKEGGRLSAGLRESVVNRFKMEEEHRVLRGVF